MLSNLRANSAEVLVSPRVRTIPKSYRFTVITHMFIIAISIGVAYTYTILATETTCQAKTFDDSVEGSDFECDVLALRREQEVFVEATANTTSLYTSIKADIQLLLSVPSFLDNNFRKLNVAPGLTDALWSKIELMNGYTDPDTFEFIIANLQNATKFEEFLTTDSVLQQYFTIFFLPLGTLERDPTSKLLTKTQDLKQQFTPVPVDLDFTENFDLFVEWKTLDAGTTCYMQASHDVSRTSISNIFVCYSDQTDDQGSVFKFSWTSETTGSYIGIMEAWAAMIQSMQSPLVPDSFSQELLRRLMLSNYFYCCFPDRLDFAEYFGIISGLGFLLEGFFTFALIAFIFKGTIKDSKGKDASNARHSFEYQFTIGNVVEEIDMQAERKKEMEIEKKSVLSVRMRDIIRVVFNPRCRYIPYASIISFLSLAALIGLSAYLAVWYKEIQTKNICSPTPANEAAGECIGVALTNVAYAPLTAGPDTALINILSTFSVDGDTITDFDLESFFNSSLVNRINDICDGLDLENCVKDLEDEFDYLDGENYVFSNYDEFPTPILGGVEIATTGGFDLAITTRLPGDVQESVVLRFFITLNNNTAEDTLLYNIEVSAEYQFQNAFPKEDPIDPLDPYAPPEDPPEIEFEPVTYVYFRSSYTSTLTGSDRVLDPLTHGGDFLGGIFEILYTREGSEAIVETPFEQSFVQCCADTSLSYYDYLGLMMGYVALFEGLLTFLVAFFFYEFLRVVFCMKGKNSEEEAKEDVSVAQEEHIEVDKVES